LDGNLSDRHLGGHLDGALRSTSWRGHSDGALRSTSWGGHLDGTLRSTSWRVTGTALSDCHLEGVTWTAVSDRHPGGVAWTALSDRHLGWVILDGISDRHLGGVTWTALSDRHLGGVTLDGTLRPTSWSGHLDGTFRSTAWKGRLGTLKSTYWRSHLDGTLRSTSWRGHFGRHPQIGVVEGSLRRHLGALSCLCWAVLCLASFVSGQVRLMPGPRSCVSSSFPPKCNVSVLLDVPMGELFLSTLARDVQGFPARHDHASARLLWDIPVGEPCEVLTGAPDVSRDISASEHLCDVLTEVSGVVSGQLRLMPGPRSGVSSAPPPQCNVSVIFGCADG
jgi:hypothetical protein